MNYQVYRGNAALGEDYGEDLTLQHAAKAGYHDAVSTMVHWTIVLGTAVIVAGVILKPRHMKKIVSRVL